jgi:hypothetical protein
MTDSPDGRAEEKPGSKQGAANREALFLPVDMVLPGPLLDEEDRAAHASLRRPFGFRANSVCRKGGAPSGPGRAENLSTRDRTAAQRDAFDSKRKINRVTPSAFAPEATGAVPAPGLG